jgi:hypothetical protein
VFGSGYDLSWLSIVPIEGDAEVGPDYGTSRKVLADPGGAIDWEALLQVTV